MPPETEFVTDRRLRLLRALAREPVDRPPVICTGGSMSAVPAAVVEASGFSLPEAHLDPEAMAGLALAAARIGGFESVGVPLCVTVEAEALGATVDLGDAHTEARLVREPFASATEVRLPPLQEALRSRRAVASVEAARLLRTTAGDLPVFANLVGPVSLAASLVEPTAFLRELRTRPQEAQSVIDAATDFLIAWGTQLVEAGSDAVVIHEDTTTPSLVGPRIFATFIHPALKRIVEALQARGAKVLLHMCGTLGRTAQTLESLGIDGFIPDTSLPLNELALALPNTALIGNVGTFLLHKGTPEAIASLSLRLAQEGRVHVVSPACGMSSATPLANLLAMTESVKTETSSHLENLHV